MFQFYAISQALVLHGFGNSEDKNLQKINSVYGVLGTCWKMSRVGGYVEHFPSSTQVKENRTMYGQL